MTLFIMILLQAKVDSLSLTYQDALELAIIKIHKSEMRDGILGADAAIMSAKAMFDPSFNISAGKNSHNTSQQCPWNWCLIRDLWPNVNYRSFNTAYRHDASLDWTTSRSTSLFTSQEFSRSNNRFSQLTLL